MATRHAVEGLKRTGIGQNRPETISQPYVQILGTVQCYG